MELGVTPLIVDNTNRALWEMRGYVELADTFGYEITVIGPEQLSSAPFDVDLLTNRCALRGESSGKDIGRHIIERMVNGYELLDEGSEGLAQIREAVNPFERRGGGGGGGGRPGLQCRRAFRG